MTQKESSEVDPLDLVQERVQAGYLPDVVADDVQQAPSYVRLAQVFHLITGVQIYHIISHIRGVYDENLSNHITY